jgi:hypothetical protein
MKLSYYIDLELEFEYLIFNQFLLKEEKMKNS